MRAYTADSIRRAAAVGKSKTKICRLLRRAARLMERWKEEYAENPRSAGCCYAIAMASTIVDVDHVHAAQVRMKQIFVPNSRRPNYFGPPAKNIEVQMLALLFAAEFVESGDADDL